MSKRPEDHLIGAAAVLVIGWLVLSTVAMMQGMSHSRFRSEDYCTSPKVRWEYAIPAYRFGCWLGEKV